MVQLSHLIYFCKFIHIIPALRLALIQLRVTKDKAQNVERAVTKIREAVSETGAKLVALPECFNCPYGTKYFREYAETIPNGNTCKALAAVAKELGIFLIGGSVPEVDVDDKIYNTCTVWNPAGELIAKHRKMHLFDIDIPNGIRFQESEVLTAGDKFTTFQVNDEIKVGLGICYDIRFEEMARVYRNQGCNVLIYPGAFNMTTGPLHWELIQRCRAVDNQCFVSTVSPARDEEADYVAYANSMVVDPLGAVLVRATERESTIFADIGERRSRLKEQVTEMISGVSMFAFRYKSSGPNSRTDSGGHAA